MSIKAYYTLAKPGIIYGNAITAIGAFFLASRGQFNVVLFLAMLLGISFVMGSACVFNNYLDRDIDMLMKRTKIRALVTQEIPGINALVYATVLGILGLFALACYTNLLTAGIALFGFFMYVAVYGIAKRRTVHGTVIGSISGAVPPVVGYCAVTNQIDAAAIILFLILVCWQMPHFYAIAIFRQDDYTAAKIPVLPAVRGIRATKVSILGYIVAFMAISALLTAYHYTGYIYLAASSILGLAWLRMALQGFTKKDATDDKLWARKVFRFSLITLTALSVLWAIAVLLP
jgi:protoheme IX farnesyltransferase